MKKYLFFTIIALVTFVAGANAQNYTFSNDLIMGSSGQDVVNLQTWLISNGYDIPAISSGAAVKGYFGSQTKAALINFQRAIGFPAFGFFGPMTRGRLNGGSNNQQSPVISGIDAPTSLTINQTGTWTVRATDPLNATLSYSVDWGDSNILPPGMVGNAVMQSFIQGTTFTHSYMNAGIYTVKVTVRNSGGLTAQIGSTVQVTGSNAAGPLRIISPNGGEVWQKGTTQTITWTSPYYFKATYADLKLVPYYQPCTGQICPMTAQSSGAQSSMMYPYRVPYTIVSGISINQNSYNWNVGAYIFNSGAVPGYTVEPVSFPIVAPDGQYTIQLCETGTSNCDSSDGYFNVISAGIPNLSQCPVGYTCTPNTY